MVVAHHLIWTAYGRWLPNDPRGSMSHEIRVEQIASLGPGHFGRKQVQPAGREVGAFYREARHALRHPLLILDGADMRTVAEAFVGVIDRRGYTCYACAVMPDHVHLLIRRHRDRGEEMIARFQGASVARLIGEGRRATDHPVWGGPGWNVFLDGRRDVERVSEYIRLNPIKAGRSGQEWPFVTPYDGWLPGGHPEAWRGAKPQAAGREPR